MPAQLPSISTLDANGMAEWLAEETYLTEPNGRKLFDEIPREEARRDNLKHFTSRKEKAREE